MGSIQLLLAASFMEKPAISPHAPAAADKPGGQGEGTGSGGCSSNHISASLNTSQSCDLPISEVHLWATLGAHPRIESKRPLIE